MRRFEESSPLFGLGFDADALGEGDQEIYICHEDGRVLDVKFDQLEELDLLVEELKGYFDSLF